MGEKNFCDLILGKYDKLTKQTKTVADYVLAHQRETQYMSITTLAENCGVADATVYRFCRSLGFSGYNDFKLALVKGNRATPRDMPLGLDGDITSDDSIQDMCKKLYSVNASALADTLTRLDPMSIGAAVSTLRQARFVYCLGFGGSMVIAKEAVSRFATVTNNFQQISDTHMQAMAVSLAGPQDVILLFSFSGATRDIFDVLQTAKKRGVKIILVTHFPKSPAAAYADTIITCGVEEGPMNGGSIAAKIGLLFIIDILFNEYCREDPVVTAQNLDATTHAVSTKLM